MKYKIILLLLVFGLMIALPKQTSAFWWFNKPKVATTTVVATVNDQAVAKYKIWESAFEKKNVDLVMANQNNFSFTIQELNYLFETEVKTIKSPTLTNVSLTSSDGNINVAANFHKFISGRFSFVAKIVSVDNKIRLKLSYVKLYGFSIPTNWLEEPVNKELDKYFAFLYKDTRYKGFTFTASDTLLQLKPNF